MNDPASPARIPAAYGLPEAQGLYHPANEHDACGVGFIAKLDGKPRHEVITQALDILVRLEHRGGLGSDKNTGDGAGILTQIPDTYLRKEYAARGKYLPANGHYGTGLVFLPQDEALAARCVEAVERQVAALGLSVFDWREVPLNIDALSPNARATMPGIRQLVVEKGRLDPAQLELKLYVLRRCIENEISAWEDPAAGAFYIVSLSTKTLIYKGMCTGSMMTQFYRDLASPLYATAMALVHQRYATNTFPTWALAQPFRFLAHNGEINTLRGNINRMKGREATLASPLFGEQIELVKPILNERGSDSAIADNMLELLVRAGRSLPQAMMMLVPEAWENNALMSRDKAAFYEYHAAIMEPWDGPAALMFTDGRYIGATLDRNGLRPARYTITNDGTVVLASETGVMDIAPENIRHRGRLQPGKMFLVDLKEQRIVPDQEIKAKMSRRRPYRQWVRNNLVELRGLHSPTRFEPEDADTLLLRKHAFGYTDEDLRLLLEPMALHGQEAVGSMGNDAALAVLSNRPQLLFAYFKQLFAQVTNPPIDPLREELVMSLMGFVGRERNLLDETPQHCRRLLLKHPILTPQDCDRLRNARDPDLVTRELPLLFPAGGDGASLEAALDELFAAAEAAIAEGATILLLSDKGISAELAPIPSLLAVAGLHHHLIRKGLRTQASIIIDSCEPREVIQFALLHAYGANAVCPSLAFSIITTLAARNQFREKVRVDEATDHFITAIKKGLLKTFSRMGISTLRSFIGCQIFEAVGIGEAVIDRYFTGTASRVGGIGLDEIAAEVLVRHRKAYPEHGTPSRLLDVGGVFAARVGGQKHLWTSETIYKLQAAARNGDYEAFKDYTRLIDDQSRDRATLRSLLTFRETQPVPLSEVEPVENITARFVTAAMSFGSISQETHEAIAIAMNRIGGRSNSGEGGEDPARYKPDGNGDRRVSRIKQVASGRFGVTPEYLLNADELQIKIAQGAKPGEGGQLPAHKVSFDIARIRHTTQGVTLISPPPHHDIYSIEDLAQLIYDLKAANPKAKVSVKLVSAVGVGTIAAGVAKAQADLVLIAGHDGGTGASPLTSIFHVGLPWELGLSETQQTLRLNGLRDRITVQVDGQLKTGRDLAIAALMGAEEFGFGTTVLVSLGCIMMRKCHLNTCPVGVATQDERLRARFTGEPEHVITFLRFIAEELREHMAMLGFRSLNEMTGRTDLLTTQPDREHPKARHLNLSRLIMPIGQGPARKIREQQREEDRQLEARIIADCAPALEQGQEVSLAYPITNTDRTIATTLSHEVVKRFGPKGLHAETINLRFTGSAGQSFGAFLAPGIDLRVEGDANDYVGKGMSGGRIVITPQAGVRFQPHENVIAGNVILYGATGGEVYIRGIVGERFCVRNSGAKAVVEGVGAHGCEYMTGGVAVVLGQTGPNFAAGMSGGVAFVYDETELFDTRCNLDMVDLESVWTAEDRTLLAALLENHARLTGSRRAQMILDDWEAHLPLFVKVMPLEYRAILQRMKLSEDASNASVAATEEVYDNG